MRKQSAAQRIIQSRELIAAAIKHDEVLARRYGESMLQVPLETGLLYNKQAFFQALTTLEKKQAQGLGHEEQEDSKATPITPLILGGFLAQVSEEGDGNKFNDLVSYCTAMRRAALVRVRKRKRRKTVTAPFFSIACLLIFVIWTLSDLNQLIIRYGFGESCDTMACRLAEFQIWKRINANTDDICTSQSCPLHEEFSLHASLKPEWIPLTDITGHRKGRKGQSWFEESVVNRLVRDAMMTHQSQLQNLKVADIGCGCGGTLFSLLSPQIHQKKLQYYGISISAPEIYQARRLVEQHQLDSERISFSQQSFDSALNQTGLSTMLAIESLSYSPNLNVTLKNLASTLQPRGIMIVVDDVLTSWAEDIEELRNATARPSLLSNDDWKRSFLSNGFLVKETIDISLEYNIIEGSRSDSRAVWIYYIGQKMTESLEFLFGTGKSKDKKAHVRAIQLMTDYFWQRRADLLREEAYRKAYLSYNMYICIRK